MIHEILIGTHNRHKTEEIAHLLLPLGVRIRNLNEFPQIRSVEEDGQTLLENSQKKANTYGEAAAIPCLADDTGLLVEALGGAPGVYSARYAGEHCNYLDNCLKLLKELGQNINRKAIFKTVLSFYNPQTRQMTVTEGQIEGEITWDLRGENGFGYDPIFFVQEAGKTLAEMTVNEKNKISHRARALKKMVKIIEDQCREF